MLSSDLSTLQTLTDQQEEKISHYLQELHSQQQDTYQLLFGHQGGEADDITVQKDTGNRGDTPSNHGDTPGSHGDTPGNHGDTPGSHGDTPGNHGDSSNPGETGINGDNIGDSINPSHSSSHENADVHTELDASNHSDTQTHGDKEQCCHGYCDSSPSDECASESVEHSSCNDNETMVSEDIKENVNEVVKVTNSDRIHGNHEEEDDLDDAEELMKRMEDSGYHGSCHNNEDPAKVVTMITDMLCVVDGCYGDCVVAM